MFDGARADLSKVLSANPAFQVTHAFTLGSQTQEPSYNFSSLFISDRVSAFFQHSSCSTNVSPLIDIFTRDIRQ